MFLTKLWNKNAWVAMQNYQRAAGYFQVGLQLDQAIVNELDSSVFFFIQFVQNGRIKNKNMLNFGSKVYRLGQWAVIVQPQISTKPHQCIVGNWFGW